MASRCCYLIRCKYTGHFKVGVASDPHSRITTMQSGCPTELELVAVAGYDPDGASALEGRILGLFREFLVRPRSEWVLREAAWALPETFAREAAMLGLTFMSFMGPLDSERGKAFLRELREIA